MLDKAKFKRAPDTFLESKIHEKFRLDWRYLFQYLKGTDNTPIRALTNRAFDCLIPYIENEGLIIELGSGTNYYKERFPPSQQFLTSNLNPGFDLELDMTKLSLGDSSVDAFISIFAIEHIYDFESTVNEVYRCLKPGGRYLLVSPFLYYYHAAPDDYHRFTISALERLFSKYKILHKASLGNRALLFSEFYLELDVMGLKGNNLRKFLIRIIGAFFCFFGINSENDPIFSAANIFVFEKINDT